MALAEGSAVRFAYKFYSSGDMDTNAEEDYLTDPDGSSGGQIIRRVTAGITLRSNFVASPELLQSRQVRSNRKTTRWVEGPLGGVLSPGTYGDLFEAAFRGTAAPLVAVSITESDCTSVAADNATSKFTFASGNPVTLGLRVGGIIQFAGMSVSANNGVRFLITGFGGTNNREVSVYPAPTDQTADTAFTLTTPGQSVTIPSSGHVKRKLAIEKYDTDLDRARLYTECRVTGFSLSVPAEGNATVSFNFMGRNSVTLTGSDAPYFVSPTAETTTDIANSLNGLLMIDGVAQGVLTGINVNFAMSPDAPKVVGQAFVTDVLLGVSSVTGDFTALVDDADAIMTAFKNESEVGILLYLTSGTAQTADGISVYMARVKVTGAEENSQGEGSQIISGQFQALEYTGATTGGKSNTTIRLTDTAWT